METDAACGRLQEDPSFGAREIIYGGGIGGLAGDQQIANGSTGINPSARPDLAPDPRHPILTLYCGHCGHPLKVQLSCGSRVCPHCRRKWFGYHFNALYKLVKTWPVIHSMTLTVRNIPDAEFGRYCVKEIRANFSRLRAVFKKQIAGGFYVVQATNKGKGWHLHLHIIFNGEFIKQEKISAAWEKITGGSYIVDVRDVKNPKKALQYLLADFSGAPRIRPEDCDTYDAVFKGSRLVQPFGAYRAYKFKVPFKCPECGCTYWATIEELLDEKRRSHTECREGP